MSRKFVPFLFSLALVSPVQAESAPLGRLFFSPEARAALDRQRQFLGQDSPESPAGLAFRIDGTVRRSNGRHTTWINGKALTERDPPPELADRLKPGQTMHLETGRQADLLQDGQLAVSHNRRSFSTP